KVLQAGLHIDNGHYLLFLQKAPQQMPRRGMSAAHSASSGMIDGAHQEQCHAVWRGSAEGVDDLPRWHAKGHGALPRLVGPFFEDAARQRLNLNEALARQA